MEKLGGDFRTYHQMILFGKSQHEIREGVFVAVIWIETDWENNIIIASNNKVSI